MARERALDERHHRPAREPVGGWAAWRELVGDDLVGGYARVVHPKGVHVNEFPDGPWEEQ